MIYRKIAPKVIKHRLFRPPWTILVSSQCGNLRLICSLRLAPSQHFVETKLFGPRVDIPQDVNLPS